MSRPRIQIVIGEVKKIFTKFCRTTTIQGFRYIERTRGQIRVEWIIFTAIMITVCLWKCGLNLETYLAFDVKTKITYRPSKSTDFPSITFCPQYNFKRSGMSSLMEKEYLMAFISANDKNHISRLIKENNISCKTDPSQTEFKSIRSDETQQAITNGSAFFSGVYFLRFEDSLLKCHWKNKLFNCSNGFINHIGEYGPFFTFNPGKALAFEILSGKIGTGLNYSNYVVTSYDVDTPNSGLLLEMKLNQSELCGNGEIKKGIGIWFSIHRKERIPSFYFNKFYALSPGYETRISLSKVKYIRNTEHLGKCSTHFNLFITPNASEYIQDMCLLQCITELTAKMCGCMLPHSAPYRKIFVESLNLNETEKSKFKVCVFDKFRCMSEVYTKAIVRGNHFLYSMCQTCPEPCQAEEYKIQMSSLLIKKPEELKQSFLTVSFGFASMSVETVVESQAFTIVEFFIYVGNNIILYLGMSFMSSFEIFDLILHMIFAVVPELLQKFKRKTKVQRIYINPKCKCAVCKRTKYVFSRKTRGNTKLHSRLERK